MIYAIVAGGSVIAGYFFSEGISETSEKITGYSTAVLLGIVLVLIYKK